jgi:predicted nucleic-acid-binding protein
MVWILEEAYRSKKEEVILRLKTLLEIGIFIFEDKASISQATWAYRKGGDWSDHLIKAQCQQHHCTSLITFDQKFAQFYPDFVKFLK